MRCRSALLGTAALLWATAAAPAQVDGTWNVDAGGPFATPSNWLGNVVPGGGGVASFPAILTAPRTVALTSPVALGGLRFDDADAAYTLAGPAILTLTPGPSGAATPIEVVSGTHAVLAPIGGSTSIEKRGAGRLVLGGNNTFVGNVAVNAGVLRVTSSTALGPAATNAVGVGFGGVLEVGGGTVALGPRDLLLATTSASAPAGAVRVLGDGQVTLDGDVFVAQSTTVGVDAGGSLTLRGEIIDNAVFGANVLTKAGGGTLAVKRLGGGASGANGTPQPIAALTLSAGTTRVTASGGAAGSTSRLGALTIEAGAQLDLSDNALVIDYAGASPIDAVRASLAAGRLIASTSPARRVGYAEAATLNVSSFAGQPVDGSALVLRPVRPGDADLNGAVDFSDLLALARNYNAAGVWSGGDFDYDGRVGFADLLDLARNYGTAGAFAASEQLASAGIDADFRSAWSRAAAQAGVTVPEPVAAGIFGLWTALLSARLRKSCATR